MSLFITFEGGEGCGKSTQSRILYRELQKLAVPAVLIHEPGITRLGIRIRRLLKWSDELNVSPTAELLLFNASRAQLVNEIIKPVLEKGTIVICDRYSDSTTAYQGYGRQLDMKMVLTANKIGMQGIVPDLTILMDIPVEEGLARKQGASTDRFEKEDLAFHRRVREGYLKLAKLEPERWLVIDAMKNRDEIEEIIRQRVSKMLPRIKGV